MPETEVANADFTAAPVPEGAAAAPAPVALATPLDRRELSVRLACGIVVGFAFVGLIDAVGFAIQMPLPGEGVRLRAAALALGFTEAMGLGAVAALIAFLWMRYVKVPIWVSVLIGTAAGAVALLPAAGVEIYRQACCTIDSRPLETVLWVVYQAGNGLAFPCALLIGAFFSGLRRLFLAPIVLGLALAIGNQVVMRDDYGAVHCTVAIIIGLLLGGALGPRAVAWFRGARTRRLGRVALGLIGAVILVGLVVPPPNSVRVDIFRDPCAFGPWLLTTFVWSAPEPRAGTKTPTSSWYTDRSTQPDVPPTTPAIVKNPVVVMVTIDATRGDVVNDPTNDKLFPTIARLKATGTTFVNATSAASQTAVSLSTVFSGKTYTELHWEYDGTGVFRFHYPAADPVLRFPEILDANGVSTAMVSPVNFVANVFGVVRGFEHERVIPKNRSHAFARQIIDPAIEILKRTGDEPLFLFFHLMEPHAPYDRGKKTGTDFERYVSEITVADRELGRFVKVLDQKFADRAIIFVGADHGEAFGEHETIGHSKTLYDELLHVPLIARTPNHEKRVVEDRVALADLGPTILDLFGVPTPKRFLGQSLVPYLEGHRVTLERPILAEGRLRGAIIMPDGMKVIDDPRRKIVEAYDLVTDPDESMNLFGLDARADEALAEIRAYYAVNTFHAPGYSAPYKP